MRTNTSHFTQFSRRNPDITFILPEPSAPPPYYTTIILPQGSTWSPDPHWHESYDEQIRCINGRLRVVLDGKARVITPEDGLVKIPRGMVHEFMRADRGGKEGDEDDGDVIVQESTDPCRSTTFRLSPTLIKFVALIVITADGLKEVFFRTLFSIVEIENNGKIGFMTILQILYTLRYIDNWNVFVKGPAGWYVTHAVYGTASFLAWLMGLRPWYEEYIPERLYRVAESGVAVERRVKDA